jgi:hypothetical protein
LAQHYGCLVGWSDGCLVVWILPFVFLSENPKN